MWPPDDRIRKTFAETARRYDDLARRRFRRIALEVIRVAEPSRAHQILDLASGSGLVAHALREKALPEPVALDISHELLSLADARSKIVGDAMALPIADESFDRVLCSLGLQMFQDPDVALAEIARVTRYGGRIGISMWVPSQSAAKIDGPVIEALDTVLASQPGYDPSRWQTRQIVIEEVAELRDALSEAGFKRIEIEHRRKRSAFKSARQYLDELKVFPATWARFHALTETSEEQADAMCIELIEKAVGHRGGFEVTEQVLIAGASRP